MAIHTRNFSKEEILTMALATIVKQMFSDKEGEITGEKEEDGSVTVYFSEQAKETVFS